MGSVLDGVGALVDVEMSLSESSMATMDSCAGQRCTALPTDRMENS